MIFETSIHDDSQNNAWDQNKDGIPYHFSSKLLPFSFRQLPDLWDLEEREDHISKRLAIPVLAIFEFYRLTKDDVFTYLLHLGYLAYNREEKTCRIPNREIRQEWLNAIETDENYAITNQIIRDSRCLLQKTLAGDTTAVANDLDISHIHVTSNRSYNNEDALQSAIYLAHLYALNHYTVIREMTTGKGFADVVFLPIKKEHPAMIIELKRNTSPETALSQIREKCYFDSLTHYRGNLLFVGISYDEKAKTHACRMERFVI